MHCMRLIKNKLIKNNKPHYFAAMVYRRTLILLCCIFFRSLLIGRVQVQVEAAIGINYGLLGDNLPSPSKATSLLNSISIQNIRIFNPDQQVLTALHGTGIHLIIGVRNEDLQQLASATAAATSWVETNIIPHHTNINFTCISAGNELIPGELAQYILPAMKNLNSALESAGITNIPISTVISMAPLTDTSPPSAGRFSDETVETMQGIVGFLADNGYPLLVNVYPYFAAVGDPGNVAVDFAMFNRTGAAAVVDVNGLKYDNLFDAMVDSVYAAVEKAGGKRKVDVLVTETGWPTAGNGELTTVEKAKFYNQNLVDHLKERRGTPRRPGKELQVYVFALFVENQKTGDEVERHWGIYNPDLTEVYHIDFS